jgi:predicted alpha-1,2-mannosidase
MKWNELLRRIEIDADTATRRVFYTALYHLLIHPTNMADVDGSYRGADDRIHKAAGGGYYTTLSLWDTYRAAFPLLTLVAPERVDGIVSSMLAHHKAQGYLPIWTAWGQENHCMIGNHALPVITAAYRRGFRGFDAVEALQAMVESSTVPHLNSDWALLDRHGYYPFDLVPTEAVSRSLETAYDDHCVAALAAQLGKQDLARTFEKRSLRYRNLHDPETKLMRGRDSLGRWRTPFDPVKATSPMNNPGDYTEANAWQYTWTPAQFDLEGMTRFMGGRSALTDMLDRFFSLKAGAADKFLGQEAMIGQYAHGNEPCHHVVWLYAFSDKPERVGELARQICADFYKDAPDGLLGNDDCGQMSAWYLFATLGFYPLDPASGDYVLGTPLVRRARLQVPGMPAFEILRTGQGKGEVLLDGKLRLRTLLPHSALAEGGSLEFR